MHDLCITHPCAAAPAGTATGRFSSTNPNMMSIPKVSEDHMPVLRYFRRYFIARPGHVLIAADYSQVELRLLAHLSGDPRMMHAYTSGRDVHVETAMQLFDKAAADITPEERQVGSGWVGGPACDTPSLAPRVCPHCACAHKYARGR